MMILSFWSLLALYDLWRRLIWRLDDEDNAFVNVCCTLNTKKADGETQIGCGVCKLIYHPIRGHRVGARGTISAVMEYPHFWITKSEWRRLDKAMNIDNFSRHCSPICS